MKRDISCEKLLLNFYDRPIENLPKVKLRKDKGPHKLIVLSDEKKTRIFALRSS